MAKIISKEEQPLLGRTIIKASLTYEGPTPTRNTVRKQLAKALQAKEEDVIVRRILTSHGGGEAAIEAAVYANPADAEAVERKNLIAKHGKQQAAAEAKEQKDE